MATIAEKFAAAEAKRAARGPLGQEESAADFALGLGRSFVYTWPEMIGIEPPKDVADWRAQHPAAAFTSEVAGYIVPYAGWAKVASKIPIIARNVAKFDKKVPESPFKAGAAREIVRFGPGEGLRIGTAALFGQALADASDREFRGVKSVALQSGVDLALGAGLAGGVFEVAKSAGKRLLKKKGVLPGAKLGDPPQLQIRAVEKALADGKVTDVKSAQDNLFSLRVKVRGATPPKKGRYTKYVNALESGASGKELGRLFKPGAGKNYDRKTFSISVRQPGTLRSGEEVKAALAKFDLTDKEGFMQFPRLLQTKNAKGKRDINFAVRRNLEKIDGDKGWFWGRDKKDGLFVMARRVEDDWVVFKTDSPQTFLPDHAEFAEMIKTRVGVYGITKEVLEPLSKDPSAPTAVLDAVVRFKTGGVFDFRDLDPRKGGMAKVGSAIMEKFGISKITDNELRTGLTNLVNNTVAPAMMQFRNSPMGGHIFAAAKIARETAEGMAERLFLGQNLGAAAGRSGWSALQLFGGNAPSRASAEKSIKNLIGKTFKDQEDWIAFQRTVINGLSPEEGVEKFGLRATGRELLEELDRVDKIQIEGKQAIQKALGEKMFEPKAHHYMLSRFWKGDHRIPIQEGRRTIGFASGKSRGAAIKEAEEIIEEAGDANLTMGAPAMADSVDAELKLLAGLNKEDSRYFGQLQDRLLIARGGPKRLTEERKGARFFVGDRPGDVWSKDFVEESVLGQLRAYQSHNAKLSIQNLYAKDLANLGSQDPTTAIAVNRRIDQVFGVQGPFTKVTNEFTDRILSPYMGKNSASKVVSAMNKAMFRLTFGFANSAFNIANAATFVQTAFPHVSWLTRAAPEQIMRYYTYWPIKGATKVEAIGALDILKLTGKSFARMGSRSDPEFLGQMERAVADGTVAPRFVEEWVGQNSTRVTQLKEVLSGEEPVSNWLAAVADWMPSMTEKFARGQAFSMGYTFFKDIMRVEDQEMLYQLSRQFVEKTQFLYGTEDRAAIMAGPLGGAFGLFKNWVMHYLSWSLEYAGEGALRGNWNPLLWSLGGTTALGGVGALPFIGAFDGVSKWMGNESLMVNLYEKFNGEDRDGPSPVSDAVYYGLPAFLGFSIQNQVAAPFADPGEDAARLFSFAYVDRFKFAGKFAGEAIDSYATTGLSPVADSRVRDLFMRAFAPKSIYRIAQGIQSETLKSLSTGLPVTKVTPAERLTYALGVNPLTVERQYRVADELWRSQNKMKEAVSSFGKEWAEAAQAGDSRALQQIVQRAVLQNVDLSSVLKSAKARLAKGQDDLVARQFSPEAIFPYRRAGLY